MMLPVSQSRDDSASHPLPTDPMIKLKGKLNSLGLFELWLVILWCAMAFQQRSLHDTLGTFVLAYEAIIICVAASLGIVVHRIPSRCIYLTNLAFSTLSLGTMLNRAIFASYFAQYFTSFAYTRSVIFLAIASYLLAVSFLIHTIYSGVALSRYKKEQDGQLVYSPEIAYQKQTLDVHMPNAQIRINHPVEGYPVNPRATCQDTGTILQSNVTQGDLVTHPASITPTRHEMTNHVSLQPTTAVATVSVSVLMNPVLLFCLGPVKLFFAIAWCVLVVLIPVLGRCSYNAITVFSISYEAIILLIAASVGLASWKNPSRNIHLTSLAFSTLCLGVLMITLIHISVYARYSYVPSVFMCNVILAIVTSFLIVLFMIHIIYSGAALSCCKKDQGCHVLHYSAATSPQLTIPTHMPNSQQAEYYLASDFRQVHPQTSGYDTRMVSVPSLHPDQSGIATPPPNINPAQQGILSAAMGNPISIQPNPRAASSDSHVYLTLN